MNHDEQQIPMVINRNEVLLRLHFPSGVEIDDTDGSHAFDQIVVSCPTRLDRRRIAAHLRGAANGLDIIDNIDTREVPA